MRTNHRRIAIDIATTAAVVALSGAAGAVTDAYFVAPGPRRRSGPGGTGRAPGTSGTPRRARTAG